MNQPTTLEQVVGALGGVLRGNPQAQIDRLASFEHADQKSLTFISNPQFRALLEKTQAGAVIMREEYAVGYKGNAIITPDPYLYYAKLTQWWRRLLDPVSAKPCLDPHAVIHPEAKVSPLATVEAGAVIARNAVIEAGVFVGAQSYIGENVCIGEDSHITPRVTILHDCRIGKRALIYSGAVIGADGFGHANSGSNWEKIEQLGAVVIGDDVDIGANTCIDRGAIDDTVIGNGVKLDNLIQIGHNVHVGDHTIMASSSGISGSTRVGKRCIIAGGVRITGHIEVVDDVIIMGATDISKSITKAGTYSGVIPFDEASAWRKNTVLLKSLASMRDRIRELEKQTSHLTSILKDGKSHD